MDLGWKVLIPLALGWFLLLAALDVGRDQDWNPVIVVVIAVAVLLAGAGLLRLAIGAARARRAVEADEFAGKVD
jgi:NADH-quinone oxidoreductase subunit H